MEAVFNNVLILFVFTIAGYVLSKTKLCDSSNGKLLSSFLVYIFFPCKIFKTLANNLTVEYLSEKYTFIIASFCMLMLIVALAYTLPRFLSKDSYQRKIMSYSLVVPNFGYLGYALISAAFGEKQLLSTIIYALPVTMFTYTVGFSMLTKVKITPKGLIKPVFIAIILGGTVGLSGLKLPAVLNSFLDTAAGCMGPVSMLLLGLVLSEFPLKEIINDYRVYIIVALRLVIIPVCATLILKHFCSPDIVIAALGVYAMPCGMNSVVFPRLVDEDCKLGAGLACVSTILCCITIPVIFGILG